MRIFHIRDVDKFVLVQLGKKYDKAMGTEIEILAFSKR